MFGFGKKNKPGSFSAETSKKVAYSRAPSRPQVDGIFRKEKFVKKEETTLENKIDNNKRTFLKVAGATGLGLAATVLFPKAVDAYVAGSTPTSNVVGLKDDSNTRINPATEETVSSLLKTSDLTFDTGSLQVKVTSQPSGSSSFSDSGDVAKSGRVDDTTRHVYVDVKDSVLPTAASTETTLSKIALGGVQFALRLETVGDIDYLGEAQAGTAIDAVGWRIKKIDSSTLGTISITWADGTELTDKKWSLRTTYTYS